MRGLLHFDQREKAASNLVQIYFLQACRDSIQLTTNSKTRLQILPSNGVDFSSSRNIKRTSLKSAERINCKMRMGNTVRPTHEFLFPLSDIWIVAWRALREVARCA